MCVEGRGGGQQAHAALLDKIMITIYSAWEGLTIIFNNLYFYFSDAISAELFCPLSSNENIVPVTW